MKRIAYFFISFFISCCLFLSPFVYGGDSVDVGNKMMNPKYVILPLEIDWDHIELLKGYNSLDAYNKRNGLVAINPIRPQYFYPIGAAINPPAFSSRFNDFILTQIRFKPLMFSKFKRDYLNGASNAMSY